MYKPSLTEIAKKLGYPSLSAFCVAIQNKKYSWAKARKLSGPKYAYHIDYAEFYRRFWKCEAL